jgi:hypothetical protein
MWRDFILIVITAGTTILAGIQMKALHDHIYTKRTGKCPRCKQLLTE